MVHLTEECSLSDMKVKEKKKMVTKNTVRESKGAGSRRIFSPIFKLQVLDSYRKDADCQGNQRATARKYGIHRRQIQKWLQMETNLRVSVEQQSSSSDPTTALNLSPARQSDDKGDECKHNGISEEKNVFVVNQNMINCNLKDECNSDVEEYVNVDEITDTEDDEEASSSSYEETDKALDFTCATLSKRRFYTSDFKQHVIDAFVNDGSCKGNQRATARKFGIHRRQVQKWLNQEATNKSEQDLSNTCLDLSAQKRKLVEEPQQAPPIKRQVVVDQVQEAALCLAQSAEIQSLEDNNNYQHRVMYPSPPPLEHSFSNSSSSSSSLSYVSHEYPYVHHQPWSCYHPISSGIQASVGCDVMPSKYFSYSFNFKYHDDNSYVDIPVQYGFGDSIPSKWIKENPLHLHEPARISLYR